MFTSRFGRSAKTAGKGPGTPVPPTLLFVAGLVAGLWWHGYDPWPVQAGDPSTALVIIGGLLLAGGAALFVSGLVTFARARTGIMLQHAATRVVTTGPYRWSRNPQYVSFVSMYVGASLLANSLWPLILLPVVVVALNRLVIAREERYMHRLFNGRYAAYTENVPRWL